MALKFRIQVAPAPQYFWSFWSGRLISPSSDLTADEPNWHLKCRAHLGSGILWYHAVTFEYATTDGASSSRPLLECDLGKTPELPRMQPFPFLRLQLFQRLESDLEVLSHPLAVEFTGHACELDLAMQRLVGDAKKRAVGDAETKTV